MIQRLQDLRNIVKGSLLFGMLGCGWMDAKEPSFSKDIIPILEKLCIDCHDEDTAKGELNLDELNPDMVKGPDADKWHEVLNKLNVGEMPPEDKKQPSDKEREVLTSWLNQSLKKAAEARRSTDGRVVFRRLNREEYNNTLNDLFGIDLDITGILPPERPSEEGFINNGQELVISPLHLEYFLKIARLYTQKAIFEGERPAPTGFFTTIIGEKVEVSEKDKKRQQIKLTPKSHLLQNPDKSAGIGMQIRGKNAPKDFDMVNVNHIALPPAIRATGTQIPARQGPQPSLLLTLRDFLDEGDVRLKIKASYNRPDTSSMHLKNRGTVYLEVFRPHFQCAEQKYYKNAAPESTRFLDDFDLKQTGTAIEQISLRFSSILEVPKDGKYKFYLDSDDGSCLYIDDKEITKTYNAKSTAELELKAGSRDIILNYYDSGGGDRLSLEWEGPDFERQSLHTLRRDPKFENIEKVALKKIEPQFPFIGVRMGNFLDDGLELKPVAPSQEVQASSDKPQTYEFIGRLENLPLPFRNKDLSKSGDLNRALILITNEYESNIPGYDPILEIHSIEFEAPFHAVWPPKPHQKIFHASPNSDKQEVYAKEIFENFLTRAYRRAPTQEELADLLRLWKAYRENPAVVEEEKLTFEQSIAAVLPAALIHPAFLYLVEPAEDGKIRELNSHETASRLSYFLWASMPDEELSQLADQNKLKDPKVLRQQVRRLLSDSRSEAFYRNFIDQWLELDALDLVAVDRKVHRTFQPYLREAMRQETRGFFQVVLENDLSAFNLIDSDFLWLNPMLAKHYNIPGVLGEGFRKVPASKDYNRGGLLTHASILTSNSSGTDSHPIKRGTWLLKRFLNSPPPPPPPNVPELDQEDPDLRGKSLKEQLVLHRENPACMNCHKKIDPFGIPFENYNTVGQWRTSNKGKSIDASAQLPDGTVWESLKDLQTYLLQERKDQFARALCAKLLSFSLGRSLSFADDEQLDLLQQEFAKSNYRLKALIEAIVLSDAFLLK